MNTFCLLTVAACFADPAFKIESFLIHEGLILVTSKDNLG